MYFYFCFRKLPATSTNTEVSKKYPEPVSAIKEKGRFAISCIIFVSAVILLVTHAITGLTVASIGVMIAAATLLTSGKESVKFIKRADYKTLSFFIGLFIVVSGLEKTGVLNLIAGLIEGISGNDSKLMVAIICGCPRLPAHLWTTFPLRPP